MLTLRTYSESEEVSVQGAKFLVGWIPHGKYSALMLAAQLSEDAARRRVLLALRSEGQVVSDELVVERLALDPERSEAHRNLHREVVAWGVKGHADVVDSNGQPIAWEGVEREYCGQKYLGTSDRLVSLYADDVTLLRDLFLAVANRNTLTPASKKNSSPLSITAVQGGDARTA